jgi:hypothetical protein
MSGSDLLATTLPFYHALGFLPVRVLDGLSYICSTYYIIDF